MPAADLLVHAPPREPVGDLDRELPCPLCGYDLRGLPPGRCPECGHAFDPAELARTESFRHPWLFEHHAGKKPLRSFLRTLLACFRPHRFWTTLRPQMPIRMRPLLLFALLISALGLTSLLQEVVTNGFALWQRNSASRQMYLAYHGLDIESTNPIVAARIAAERRRVNNMFPMPDRKQFWLDVWRTPRLEGSLAIVVVAGAWPWVTLATLLIFRQSLRQARIHTGHVLRACVYSGVWVLLVLPVTLLLSLLFHVWQPQWLTDHFGYGSPLSILFDHAAPAAIMAIGICFLGAGFAVWQAYARYLRFPHAAATVLASQVIVWLLALLAVPAAQLILS